MEVANLVDAGPLIGWLNAGINPHTLQAKIRRETPLTATETAALVAALKRFRLATIA